MKSLTHFHSPITKQKLSLIRPSPPQISYSSYEEINNKFKELCLQSKDEKPHHSSNYFNQESLEEHTLNRYLIKTTDKNRGKEHRRISLSTNFQRKSTQNHSIKIDSVIFKNSVGDNNTITDLVKEQIEKNQEMTSHGHINSVVKFFGNNLIASVFQALLIKSIEEVFPGPFENSNAMSSK